MQAPQKHQKYVSHVLGLPMSKVVCKTKRIGGGFGGKETRSAFIAAAASVPSYLLNRPVKITLDRDTDMMITGQRHSFIGKYKVSFCYYNLICFRTLTIHILLLALAIRYWQNLLSLGFGCAICLSNTRQALKKIKKGSVGF